MDDVAVIDRFLNTFSTYIDSGFGLLNGEVTFLTATLVAIDMTLAGLFWAMGHSTGQGEDVLAKLIRKVLYVGAFAYIIGNFNSLSGIVFRSFAGLGLQASGSGMSLATFLQPGHLAKAGIDAAAPILQQISDLSGFPEVFINIAPIVVLFLAWLTVIVSFFVLAVQLFVTLLEFKLTTLCRLRADAVCLVEQNHLPGREGAGQRGVLRHQGAGACGDRGHRHGSVLAVPHSTDRALHRPRAGGDAGLRVRCSVLGHLARTAGIAPSNWCLALASNWRGWRLAPRWVPRGLAAATGGAAVAGAGGGRGRAVRAWHRVAARAAIGGRASAARSASGLRQVRSAYECRRCRVLGPALAARSWRGHGHCGSHGGQRRVSSWPTTPRP